MIRSNYEAGSYQVWAQKREGSYHCQVLPVRCVQFLILVIVCSERVTIWATISNLLFLENYIPNLRITSIGTECVVTFRSRASQDC